MNNNTQQPDRTHQSAPTATHRRRWLVTAAKIVLPLTVSVLLCWSMFRDVDLDDVVLIVKNQCDFRWIAVNIAFGLMAMVFRAWRWGMQLEAIGVKAPHRILCYSIFGCYALNIIFPRLGEVWRSGYIAYRQKASFSGVLGSMVADRLADTLTVLALTAVAFVVAHGPLIEFIQTYPDAYRRMAALAANPLLWLALPTVAAAVWFFFKTVRNRYTAKVRQFFKGIWSGFAAIALVRHKGRWLLLTALIWGSYFMQLYVSFFAFPFTRQILECHGATGVLVCMVLTSISMGVPASGGIGPYQVTMKFALRLLAPAAMIATAGATEVFRLNAVAFGNLLIGVQTLVYLLLGIVTFALIAIDKRRTARSTAAGTCPRPCPEPHI